MNATLPRDVQKVMKWGVVVFLVVNAFSWNPGWGGRVDSKPGREVERYFGWPACFYCDQWRSDHDHEVALAAYFPPIPLSREMHFVYFNGSVLAFLLNVAVAVCGTFLVVILVLAESRGFRRWMLPVGVLLGLTGLLIVMSAEEFSAYL